MGNNKILDGDDDTSLVRRIVHVARREGVADELPEIVTSLEEAARLREEDGREAVDASFDPDELTTGFRRLYALLHTRLGAERLWSDEEQSERPTLPPGCDPSGTPAEAVTEMRDRARTLGLSASRALRCFNGLSHEAGDRAFVLSHLQWLISSIAAVSAEKHAPSSEMLAFLDHAERDLGMADRLTRSASMREIEATASQIVASMIVALKAASGVERSVLYDLSDIIENARMSQRLGASRPLLFEASVRAHLFSDPYPVLWISRQMEPRQARAEMPTISSEIDEALTSKRQVRDPQMSSAIAEAISLGTRMHAAMLFPLAREHVAARLQQLRELEQRWLDSVAMVEAKEASAFVSAIRSDFSMIERIARAAGNRFPPLWREIRYEMVQAMADLKEGDSEVDLLRDLHQQIREAFDAVIEHDRRTSCGTAETSEAELRRKVEAQQAIEELRRGLTEGHIRAARILLPYDRNVRGGGGGSPLPSQGGVGCPPMGLSTPPSPLFRSLPMPSTLMLPPGLRPFTAVGYLTRPLRSR